MEPIGRYSAANLKSIAPHNLTEDQKKQLDEWENRDFNEITPEQKKNRVEYFKKVISEDVKEIPKLTKDKLWQLFNIEYHIQNGVDFVVNKESLQNIMPVMYYFLRDDKFFECQSLSDKSEPSFDKGIMLIGSFGNGKSSIMETMQSVLRPYGINYAFRNMNNIVSTYETCSLAEDKTTFWHFVERGNCCFDDVKTERHASNYGKTNLFKDIFEKRSLNRDIITHITCNYKDSAPNDLDAGLNEFIEKYGGRTHDRLFQKLNIIEFKGKSMRK